MASIGVHFTGPALHGVTSALARAGHEVHVVSAAARIAPLVARTQVDAWIVEAAAETVLSELMATGDYVLPADNIPPVDDRRVFSRWMDGLLRQLDFSLLQPAAVACAQERERWREVRAIWLLAGSAGATEAVQQFLSAFASPPPVAFLYAQHLSPGQDHQLEQFTLQNTVFDLEIARGSHTLRTGQILMLSPRHKIVMNNFGRLSNGNEGWSGGHTPDFNELLVLLSTLRGIERGAILFSGMGDDGSEALPIFDASGGDVWAQSPGTALSPSLPSAAVATGVVKRVASPVALAGALERRYCIS